MSNSSKDFDPPFRQNMDPGTAEQDRVTHDSPSLIRHKYIVTSNKRGVGKTSLAANLAVTLSKRKVKVGLIDLDLHGTNICRMLGLQGIYETDVNKQFVPDSYLLRIHTYHLPFSAPLALSSSNSNELFDRWIVRFDRS